MLQILLQKISLKITSKSSIKFCWSETSYGAPRTFSEMDSDLENAVHDAREYSEIFENVLYRARCTVHGESGALGSGPVFNYAS